MPDRPTALTAATGEHYVAYMLSAQGFTVALTRAGSPGVDLMVGSPSTGRAVMLQVKTSNWARREYKRKPHQNHWEWDVGQRAMNLRGADVFYAFVDLRWGVHPPVPDVFIVPANTVADALGPGWSRYMYWIMDADAQRFRGKWNVVAEALRSLDALPEGVTAVVVP